MKSNPNEPPETVAKLKWWQYPLEYLLLLRRNPRYRLYLLSHICQHVGDWYIRIASLLALDRLAPGSATAISMLLLVKMGPHALLPAVGGALADSLDRRKMMIVLDSLGAIVTLGFVIAVEINSLPLFYAIAAMRATILSLYEPPTKALVPMIVTDHEDLKRAMTLNGLAWSSLIMVGGVIAGQTSAYFGVQACFVIDSVSYFVSAVVLCFMRGNYKVLNDGPTLLGSDRDHSNRHFTVMGSIVRACRPVVAFWQMLKAVVKYLSNSGFGMLVLLKSSGSLIWGASDVLNIEYAHIPDDEEATSSRLGLIFSCIGLGCFVGPMFANLFTDPDRPATVQLICIGAMALMMSGWIGFSQANSFATICIFTALRSFGSSIIWVNSSLLLQRLTIMEMMGRVLALEFASMMFCDALMASITGKLLDAGVAKTEISVGAAILAATLFFLWTIYHTFGKGAARKQFNQKPESSAERVAQVVFA